MKCGSCGKDSCWKRNRRFCAPFLFGFFFFAGIFIFPPFSEGTSSPEDLLFSHMRKLFAPESMEMVLDAPVEPDGNVRHMYLRIQGASFSDFRVEEIVAEFSFLRFSPLEEWGASGESMELLEALSVHFTARILEKDLNGYLLGKTLDLDSSQWRDVYCDILPEGIHATARADLFLSGNVRAVVDLRGTFRLREGNQIFLEDTVFSVNGGEKEIGAVEEALREMQPIIDFRELPFPVRISTLELSEEAINFATRVPPREISGSIHRSFP